MHPLVKYPRTPHLPWSESVAKDDIRVVNTDVFVGKNIVVTEKMDGENTTLTRECCHARSLDSGRHESRSWIKALWQTIKFDIPAGWRICGENLYATHSIHYKNLKSYFMVFSIWDENNIALAWNDTIDICKSLNLEPVSVLWSGVYDEAMIKNIKIDFETQEGYVIRNAEQFEFRNFTSNVAKFVRPNHVQTDIHWLNSKIIPNELSL